MADHLNGKQLPTVVYTQFCGQQDSSQVNIKQVIQVKLRQILFTP